MLSNTLVTNEIKTSGGVEVEFDRLSMGDRTTEFAYKLESPSYPFRLTISHTETGTGTSARRRSVVRFDKTAIGQVDALSTMRASAYIVLDSPIGNMTNTQLSNDVIAAILSFCATTGAATTVLFDGTGNGAAALISGGL